MDGNCNNGHLFTTVRLKDGRQFYICPRCQYLNGPNADTVTVGELQELVEWCQRLLARPCEPLKKKRRRGPFAGFEFMDGASN